jgi:hypothetical protein
MFGMPLTEQGFLLEETHKSPWEGEAGGRIFHLHLTGLLDEKSLPTQYASTFAIPICNELCGDLHGPRHTQYKATEGGCAVTHKVDGFDPGGVHPDDVALDGEHGRVPE